MKNFKDFEKFEERLNSLDEDIRSSALEYASQLFSKKNISREEALEKGISRAELEKRNL
ncbi:hypothetical protein [Salinimicrobium terrae]|uniref:hypothetical protein n=1 Tax=Salinimicrobium terrae TaxID=470866 RepID=UPI0003FA644F|nr:hypothetical protein [Salinimicrobium terrae]